MPLTVKAFRGKTTPTYIQVEGPQGDELQSDEDSLQDAELHIHQVFPIMYYTVFVERI